MDSDQFWVSYVRKPLAKHGFYSFFLAIVGLGLFCYALRECIRSNGGGDLTMSAVVLVGGLFQLAAIGYGIAALTEKEKNQWMSWTGMALAGVQIFTCAVIVVMVNMR
ncbi:MAG: hypothetical protein LBR77_03540 [Lachnospiraceae bacterium]|jgi:hypothetical protein|nr:hypothetical protein [Lachnospiraceae bacterium]